MCFGFTGSPSLKSKADALKYAIEFTAIGQYPNRAPDIKKAKELYNFICENVQLPDVETDEIVQSPERIHIAHEEVEHLKVSSPLSPVANNLRSILHDNNFESIFIDAYCNSSKEIFQLKRNGEALRVTIVHITTPIE